MQPMNLYPPFLRVDEIEIVERLNPRQRRNAEADEQLYLSIKHRAETIAPEAAIIEPLTVVQREGEGGKAIYILANGERRLTAAKRARLEQVPVLLNELTNEEIYELRLLESLQHNELHPLDESDAYANLAAMMVTEDIARKVGKPIAHVARRLKLQSVAGPVREALERNQITVDHAEVLSIYPTETQVKALKECLTEAYHVGYDDDKKGVILMPLSQLKNWLRRNVLLDLNSVGFSKSDATLVEEMGPCTTCPHRTGTLQTLFDDLPDGMCTLPSCFNKKRKEFAKREFRKAQEKYDVTPQMISTGWTSKKDVLKYNEYQVCKESERGALLGQFVDGAKEGKVAWIKINKPKTHEVADPARLQEEQEKERQKEQQQLAYLDELIKAVAPKVPKKLTDREDIVHVINRIGGLEGVIYEAYGIKSIESESESKLIQALILQSNINCYLPDDIAALEMLAKRSKIDLKKVAKSAQNQQKKSEK